MIVCIASGQFEGKRTTTNPQAMRTRPARRIPAKAAEYRYESTAAIWKKNKVSHYFSIIFFTCAGGYRQHEPQGDEGFVGHDDTEVGQQVRH